jgi:hypothetical protein
MTNWPGQHDLTWSSLMLKREHKRSGSIVAKKRSSSIECSPASA